MYNRVLLSAPLRRLGLLLSALAATECAVPAGCPVPAGILTNCNNWPSIAVWDGLSMEDVGMLRWLVGCLLIVSAQSAWADNLGNPMTFRMYQYPTYSGQHVEIQADGAILLETPSQFSAFLTGKDIPPGSEVYLTSEGGNLSAGLQLGRLIREHGFNTIVGAHGRVSDLTVQTLRAVRVNTFVVMPSRAPAPLQITDAYRWSSYCVSSCTFVMLGGVQRYLALGSIYAVHKFHFDCNDPAIRQKPICRDPAASTSSAQEQSADLAVYLQDMGISQAFLQDMVLAEPDKMKVLTDDELAKYHICTHPFGCYLSP